MTETVGIVEGSGERGAEPSAGRGPGRPVDRSGDPQILAVTLEVLVQQGYDRLTLDEVAARTGRAKTTLYRRWASKLDLVVAAVASVGTPPEAVVLPDRGSLREDLLAVVDSPWLGGPDVRPALIVGLVAAARRSPAIADVVRSRVTEPYGALYERLIRRAVERGEVDGALSPRIALVAQVTAAMTSHGLDLHERLDRPFFVALVDDVVLPALAVA